MSHIIKVVRLSLIDMDRIPINGRTLALIRHIEKGGTVPPIHVQYEWWNGRYKILDGRHRWTAFKMLERLMIPCRIGVR